MANKIFGSFSGFSAFVILVFYAGTALGNHDSYRSHREHNAWRQPFLSTYLGVGLGFGGDEVARFSDNYGHSETIYSGGGLLVEGGLSLSVDPQTHLRLSGGYQLDGTGRSNGSSAFDRLRFDLALLKSAGMHEFGVGMTAHTSVGYRCDIESICSGDIDFDHALGYTFEYAVRAGHGDRGRGVRLGVRFTGIDYRPRLQNSEILDGNSLTGFVGVVF